MIRHGLAFLLPQVRGSVALTHILGHLTCLRRRVILVSALPPGGGKMRRRGESILGG